MKILLISSQVFPVPPPAYGGLEMVVYDLAESLGRMGHDVYVLAPEGSWGEHFKALTPVMPSFNNFEQAAYQSVEPTLSQYDVIHDHSWAGHVYLALKDSHYLPVLHTLHAVHSYNTAPCEKPCWVAASKWHRDYIERNVGPLCATARHGIDVDRHQLERTKGDYLLFAGRIMPGKGPIQFVELCEKTGLPGKLAGEDWFVEDTGFVRQVMQACENSHGLVEYLGRVDQDWKIELMQGAKCLVTPLMPPYYEIFGLATVEAMACGTPVLSTNRGAAPEIIEHGVSGAVVESEQGLEAGLEIALSCDPAACRERAETYSREKMAKLYEKLYARVADGRRW